MKSICFFIIGGKSNRKGRKLNAREQALYEKICYDKGVPVKRGG